MADPKDDLALQPLSGDLLKIDSFQINGLFGESDINIHFPQQELGSTDPSIIILSGRNGTGKTTILKMISGMLRLNFDPFRTIPFHSAKLQFSSGDVLSVVPLEGNERCSLWMQWNDVGARLPKEKGDREDDAHSKEIDAVRELASPSLNSISFDFLDLDRLPRQGRLTSREQQILSSYNVEDSKSKDKTLANRVAHFLRDAQINYRRFFREEELGFLQRILQRLDPGISAPTPSDLLGRISQIRTRFQSTSRYGLHLEDEQLSILESLLGSGEYNSPQQTSLIETYVESQENAQTARDLIVNRLQNFEAIMADFLIDKKVMIDPRRGLRIEARHGPLNEHQLSSGEYHFLCMMVAALLCQRMGTIIAIDEPELSLHVTWQRKLVSALASCASGASPTFLFATHSLAISSAHADKVVVLSPID